MLSAGLGPLSLLWQNWHRLDIDLVGGSECRTISLAFDSSSWEPQQWRYLAQAGSRATSFTPAPRLAICLMRPGHCGLAIRMQCERRIASNRRNFS